MLINGKPGDRIACSDRGLQYGDGLFETLAVVQGRPCLWQRHMARLSRGESVLGLPPSDKQLLQQEALSLCKGQDQAVLKIILTRGSGGRGYAKPNPCAPRRLLSLHPWPDYPQTWYTEGLRLGVCKTRIGRNSQLAGLKHLNRLEQVLARSECQDALLDECLMMDERERVICGSQSNLFMVRGDNLYTPDLVYSGVAGVVRELVIELAEQLSIPLRITDLDIQSLLDADALFVTNSVMGLCPVSALNERRYDVEKIALVLCRRAQDACVAP
ncbi:MAG: aminodeoxychorismate lyase [Candidatus Thiodiazotropha sp. (ex Ctena orbiculata)]|nr:aminodeoxychorismate lyase [Candidatus Thiodiazotropha taylori]MBT2998361.1 aminodeoxychorismate lyase [Candidatus Thiodiazotropha taylori]MBT3000348.1 aminodeoxychorismate lyase [Candidatus Thiodiazotropha taylori]MBV2108420.1 aminodeoxychorismate lyase [Candidatus Thiodiazotropha taylori]MBV2112879.1 aminodeoxychorismate lyase [Candidatus Thiodiazotropha taylori]